MIGSWGRWRWLDLTIRIIALVSLFFGVAAAIIAQQASSEAKNIAQCQSSYARAYATATANVRTATTAEADAAAADQAAQQQSAQAAFAFVTYVAGGGTSTVTSTQLFDQYGAALQAQTQDDAAYATAHAAANAIRAANPVPAPPSDSQCTS